MLADTSILVLVREFKKRTNYLLPESWSRVVTLFTEKL